MALLTGLDIGDPAGVWADLGFAVVGDAVWVDGVALRLGGAGGPVHGWSLWGVSAGIESVDGLPTVVVDDPPSPPAGAHPNGVIGLDHLVVSTPDLDRTTAALERIGIRLLRMRETESYGAPMRQAFFRLGPVILEVVGGEAPGDGDASFFGLAFTCASLDETASFLGERMRPAKDAVQDGRRIATLAKGTGSGVAMAFMSPRSGAG